VRLGEFALREIREALAGKSGPEYELAVGELVARLGASNSTVRRAQPSASKRARRKDCGQSRTEMGPEITDFMHALTKADFSADHCIWVTARHFGLKKDFISVGAYNAMLRQMRMSRALLKRDLRPSRAFEAPRANFMHHYDTTVAEAFYANYDESIGHEPGHARYKNKPGNRRPRLVLYSLVDDFSRVLFARFYFSENTVNLLDFAFRAWSEKEDKRFPFYGIPDHLYCDLGAPRRSAKFEYARGKLGFQIPNTTPSHATEFGSRKHGKVERTFGEGLLGEFMKITRIYVFKSIEELNATLWEWLIHINNRASSTTGQVRFARWIGSVGTPRSMPSAEMFSLLHYDRVTRVVNRNLQIHINGKVFQLPYRKPFINWVEAKVEVYWRQGHEDMISIVYDHHEEELRSMAPVVDIALEYRSVEKTEREKRLEALEGASYSGVNFPAIYTPERELPYLPRKGQEFDETRIAEKSVEIQAGSRPSFAPERWLNYPMAARELQGEEILSRPLSPADQAWLKGIFGDREKISESEIRENVARLKEGRLSTGTDE
jgi:hypothetical protein